MAMSILVLPLHAQRIVSLAPSLTEICAAIGLRDQLVGRTSYCLYPEEVLDVPVIGGYLDPNLEQIVASRPDKVLALPEHRETTQRLRQLGLDVLVTKNWSIDDILNSITELGKVFGREGEAGRLRSRMEQRMAELKRVRLHSPRVLLTVGRDRSSASIREVYIVGKNGFLQELIEWAGARNVIDQSQPHFPKLSQEALFQLDPDVIIELVPEVLTRQETADWIDDWEPIQQLGAVSDGHVFVIHGPRVLIPGPGYVEVLAKLTRILDGIDEFAARR